MASMDRRSMLALGLGAATLFVLRAPSAEAAAGEEKELAKGVKQRSLGEGPAMIPGSSKVTLRDIIFEPGSIIGPNTMKNPHGLSHHAR